MRYALLSDVHANLPALEAVLRDIADRVPEAAIYHLGDLIGYSPWPNEVVELLSSRGIPGVAGNYDSTVSTGYRHCGCRSESPAQEALAHVSY
jgi:predicted phosphodiesterase